MLCLLGLNLVWITSHEGWIFFSVDLLEMLRSLQMWNWAVNSQTNRRNFLSALQNTRLDAASYQHGTTVLTYEEELSSNQPTNLQTLLGHPGDTEGSSNSEGSHATGDSGRYSHDETELTNMSSGPSSHLASPTAEDGTEFDCSSCAEELNELSEENQSKQKAKESMNAGSCRHEAQSRVWRRASVCVRVCVSVKAVVYLHKHSHNIKVCALTRVYFIVYLHCTSVSAAKNVWNHAASYLGCYEFAFLL